MNFDYSNWEEERGYLIEDLLNILREQEDLQFSSRMEGSFEILPTMFKTGKHVIYGPVGFGKQYSSAPTVTFGQQPFTVTSDVRASSTGANYTPFLVQPYVYDWDYEAGLVEGFYVGLYAISIPSALPAKHTIFWSSAGQAARYEDQKTTESWTEPYDYQDINYLSDFPAEGEE